MKNDKKPVVRMVVAVAENQVIGNNNTLIWKLSSDLKKFRELTTGFPIIMGRKTYDSIGRVLPGRRNIIITRDKAYQVDGAEIVNSPEEALNICQNEERISIIGGGEIYARFLPITDELFVTRVHTSAEGDTQFPEIGKEWMCVFEESHPADEKNEFDYTFLQYKKG